MPETTYTESQVLSCDCENLYQVIADVANYPEFLPGWESVRIKPQTDGTVRIEQDIKLGPFNGCLVSIASFDYPRCINVTPESDAAFAGVSLRWNFQPKNKDCCRLVLSVTGHAKNFIVRKILDKFIVQSSREMIGVFAQRVEMLHGVSCEIVDGTCQ